MLDAWLSVAQQHVEPSDDAEPAAEQQQVVLFGNPDHPADSAATPAAPKRGRPRGTYGSREMRQFLNQNKPAEQNRKQTALAKRPSGQDFAVAIDQSPFGSLLQRRLLHFAHQQSQCEDLEEDGQNANPAVRLLSSKLSGTLASISKVAEQHDTSRATETRNLRRVACCLSLGGGQLWALLLERLKVMMQSGKYRPVCFAKKRRYDETPLRVRIEEEKSSILPEAPTEGQTGVAGKILQTEFTLSILLQNRQTNEFLQLVGKAPTWLQVLTATTAECVKHAQQQIESNIENLFDVAELFPLCFSLPCTDMHPSNICVEKSFQHDNPKFASFHAYCLIHKIGRCIKSTISLVEGHESGVLAVGKSLEFAGSTRKLRKILQEVLSERLQVCIGEPFEQPYREAIYNLLLGSTTTSRNQKSQPLLRKKQQYILGHLLNGNIQRSGVVTHVISERVSHDVVLAMLQKFVVPALVPHACPRINRSSFLGYEKAVQWCALLAAHHDLLAPVLLRFLGAKKSELKKDKETVETQSWEQSWTQVALAALKDGSPCKPVDAGEINDAGMHGFTIEDDPEVETNQQHEHDDKNMDWHAQKKATKKKAAQYVSAKPGDVLIAICICTQPINSLMQAFIKLSSEGFDKEQKQRVAQHEQRSFRVLECWKGQQTQRFFGDLEVLLKSSHPALPSSALTESMRSLMFRLLARAGSSVEHHVSSYHKGCPFSLFGVLLGDTSVLETKQCLRDELTHKILQSFPTEATLLSFESICVITSLATVIDVDILGIEARHSATRRLVVAKSVQTWPVHMQNLSAEWATRQHRIWKDAAQLGRADITKQSKPNKTRRKFSNKRGGGGPWRAFYRDAFKGKRSLVLFQPMYCIFYFFWPVGNWECI